MAGRRKGWPQVQACQSLPALALTKRKSALRLFFCELVSRPPPPTEHHPLQATYTLPSNPTMSAPATLPTPSPEEVQELVLCARYGDDSDLDDIKVFVAQYGEKWLADARDDRGNTCLHMAGGNGHLGEFLERTLFFSPSVLGAQGEGGRASTIRYFDKYKDSSKTDLSQIRNWSLARRTKTPLLQAAVDDNPPPPRPRAPNSNLLLPPAEIVSYLLPLLPSSSLVAPNLALSTPLHWISLNFHLPILRLLCPLLPPSAFHLLNNHGKTAISVTEEACESFAVGEGETDSERTKERIRREVVVGYLLGCMGLGVKKATSKEEDMVEAEAEEAEGEGDVVMVDEETRKTKARLEDEAGRLEKELEELRISKEKEGTAAEEA